MNDEILIIVCGSASNKQTADLAEVLRTAGRCRGKIVSVKCTSAVLAEIKQVVEKPDSRETVRRRNSGSWAGDRR